MTEVVFYTWNGKNCLKFFHSVDYVSPEKQAEYAMHAHTECELYLLVRGPRMTYVVEDSEYGIRPGDMILTRAGEIHRALFREAGEYECYYLKIENDCFTGLSRRMQNPLHCFLDRAIGERNLLRPDAAQQGQIIGLFCSVFAEKGFPKDTSRLLCFSYTLQLLALVNHSFDHAGSSAPDAPLSPLMRDIICYVNDNIRSIQTVEQVAKAFFISPSYFSRLFCKSMKLSFIKYLRAKKLSLAMNCLIRGGTVTDACFESGFQDYSYFISIFHRETGMTPLQYQKKAQSGWKE